MADKRIHEVARELNLSSEALVRLLRQLGFKVRGYMSVITPEMLISVRKRIETDKKNIKKRDQEKRRLERDRRGIKKGVKKQEEQQKTKIRVKETLKKIKAPDRTRKKERVVITEVEEQKEKKIQLPELVSVEELANRFSVSPIALIGKCLELGLMVTINQRIDYETASMLASEYGYETELLSYYEEVVEEEGDLEERAPIVTVMGHVDHGKTTLLDYIRKTNVVRGEKGGITQHIGASLVFHDEKKICFLDTPGHEAFTAMRARGARITDIILIVVAADDGVMPQTVEAIDHARDANVPIVVAVNKIDLENARPEVVKGQLMGRKLLLEEQGGDIPSIPVSAKTGKGVGELLDSILLVANMQEIKARSKGRAMGYVIESRLDRYKGIIGNVVVIEGLLKRGDSFIAGTTYGRVRAMYDEFNETLEEAGPSSPVMLLGFEKMPRVGDRFVVMQDDRTAREIARKRDIAEKKLVSSPIATKTLQSVQDEIQKGETKELKMIVKGDVGGSVEAISDSLEELSSEEVRIMVVHSGVGQISESDVLLASASGSIIIGYHVKAPADVSALARKEGVELRLYDVIYKALEDIKLALLGLLEPTYEEIVIGEANIRQVFEIGKLGKIAGCYVKEGKVTKGALVKVIRGEEIIGEGKIASLKRLKDSVGEVATGYECGIGLEDVEDFEEGDIIRAFERQEQKREL